MGLRAVLLSAALICTAPAFANSAQEKYAKDYLEAAVKGDPDAVAGFYHPGEIDDLRTRVLRALEEEAAKGGTTIRRNLMGAATSLEDVRRTTPANLYLQVARRVGLPSEKVESIKALGTVEENSQLAHVVARLTPPKDSGARPHLQTVSLIRYGKDWRVALPYGFLIRVDALLEGRDDAAGAKTSAAAKPTGPANSADILRALDDSSAVLRAGDCEAYFNEYMSPKFRSSTSPKALQTLIAQCKRSEDTRETYVQALQIAKTLSPTYEEQGNRAVYDMNGQGLPFQRFVLEKSSGRWFVAE